MSKKEDTVDLRSINKDPVYKRIKNGLKKFFVHNDRKLRAKDGKFKTGDGGLATFSRIRWSRVAPLILLVAVGGGFWVFQGRAATPSTSKVYGVDTFAEGQHYYLINLNRNKYKLSAVQIKPCLSKVAHKWSRQLTRNRTLSHNKSLSADIQASCGYHKYMAIAENVAFGHDAVSMFGNLMNSSGHRANILNPKYKELGLGSWRDSTGRLYMTQIFVRVN